MTTRSAENGALDYKVLKCNAPECVLIYVQIAFLFPKNKVNPQIISFAQDVRYNNIVRDDK